MTESESSKDVVVVVFEVIAAEVVVIFLLVLSRLLPSTFFVRLFLSSIAELGVDAEHDQGQHGNSCAQGNLLGRECIGEEGLVDQEAVD